MKTHSKDHFNSIAADYDYFKRRNNLYYSTLKSGIKKEIKIKNAQILDIGCATGSVLDYIKPKYGMGVDISSEMIKIAQKKFKKNKNLKFEVFNIENKPYKKKSFDYILFNDVIEHVANQEKTIKNISKTMNKKSTLILSMANPAWEPILMLMEKLKLKMPEGPHYRISEKQLLDILFRNRLYIISKTVYLPKLPVLKDLGLIYIYAIKKMA